MKKYFASLLIWRQNHSKRYKQNFAGNSASTTIPKTPKFQATGSVNNLNKKAETPSSGRKLTAKYPDNVNAVRVRLCEILSEGARKSLPKAVAKSYVSFELTSNLQFLS